jgi:hypothetical protein
MNVLTNMGPEEEPLSGIGEKLEIWRSHAAMLAEVPKKSERELPDVGVKLPQR